MRKQSQGSSDAFTLSMLLENELGRGWDTIFVQRVRNILQSQLSCMHIDINTQIMSSCSNGKRTNDQLLKQ
jgi:hypothetical protein